MSVSNVFFAVAIIGTCLLFFVQANYKCHLAKKGNCIKTTDPCWGGVKNKYSFQGRLCEDKTLTCCYRPRGSPNNLVSLPSGGFIHKELFGISKSGDHVYRFTFKNINGLQLQVISLGAILTSLEVPDKDGHFEDIVLGYDNLAGYDTDNHTVDAYFGATIGRVCNRIKGGFFTIPSTGKSYHLSQNEGHNTLHGGKHGFDRYIWKADIDDTRVLMTMTSPDGDQGFPGEVIVNVTYQLTDDNKVIQTFQAASNSATPVNLCNHAYFNLAGQGSRVTVDKFLYQINALYITEDDDDHIPTGKLKAVKNTVYDLTAPRKLHNLPDMQHNGFDNNYCLLGAPGVKKAAEAFDEGSGRLMEVYTDQPGMQFYTGNTEDSPGKGGVHYGPYTGFAMETQNYPDAVNHYPDFPDSILQPGCLYEHILVRKYSIRK